MLPVDISSRYGFSIVLRRWFACWIDFAVLGGPLVAISCWGEKTPKWTGWLWLVFLISYFPLLEGLTGKTLGKWIAGIVVVDELGFRPGIIKATIRTVLRVVEVNPALFGGAPAGWIVWLTRTRQRLGDMAARTFVLKETDLQLLMTADGPPTRNVGPDLGSQKTA